MRRSVCLLVYFLFFFCLTLHAQNITLTGTIKNSVTGEAVPAASVVVKGSTQGAYTNGEGVFSITVPQLPVVLVVSSIGYQQQEITVENNTDVQVSFVPSLSMGEEVVVSATRTPQRIIESPVTVERVSNAAIRAAPSSNYYDIVANIKGVDVVTSSLTYKTPSTRGFNGSGNLRFNQIMDGMDNQAPGLNFPVGSIIGLTELDVESMELLPGASSALYGPGGMNGTLLINSKDPWRFQGLSFQIKQGVMHTDKRYRPVSPYYNWSVRFAENIGDKFAFKIGSEFIQANDWLAADYRNYKRISGTGFIIPGNRESDPNYDGVNMYGDETTADIRQVLQGIAVQAPFLASFIAPMLNDTIAVSRTGYREADVVDPSTVNFKLSGALHYRISPAIEAIIAGYWGTGNTVYTGSDRYLLRKLKMAQYKAELRHKYWFIRGYTTQENAGESYNATVTTRLVNEDWKPSGGSTGWYAQYGQAYLQGKLAGQSDMEAHNAARVVADQGRPAPGSPEFKERFDRIRKIPIGVNGGGLFKDKTDLYNIEGQYSLTQFTEQFAEVLVGGNFKRYVLNSEGTLFADKDGPIGINEFGAYAQAMKPFLNDRLRITLSGRYDKNQNFEGRFTPRATALVKLGGNNNLRLSYQTAYRFPSTQQQWIDLEVSGGLRLIGGVQELRDKYKVYTAQNYQLDSFQRSCKLVPLTFEPLRPESVTSYEVGYKTLLGGKILIDLFGYYGVYNDFIDRVEVVQSKTGNPADLNRDSNRQYLSVPYNTTSDVKTYGFGMSLDYRLPQGFTVGGNFSSDRMEDAPPGAFLNAPKYRTNLYIGNSGFGFKDRLGFSIIYRWQDNYHYESDFISGELEETNVVDAQVSYKMPESKSIFKLGANNLFNQYYRSAAGNPSVGGLYYISFGYNIF